MERERICAQCHAVLATETVADWCPACGGSLIERPAPPDLSARGPVDAIVVGQPGIVLPRRHALGGIITPQYRCRAWELPRSIGSASDFRSKGKCSL